MRKLFGLAAVIVASVASAAGVTVNWTHPTQFEDGTALALGQIASTRVEYGSCVGTAFGVKAGEFTINAPATTGTVTLGPGTYCFRAYTRTTAAAGGLESAPSGVASKVVPWPAPNPPTVTTVTVAWEWNSPPGKLGRVVGSVPLGTVCGDHVEGDYYLLPLDAVTLDKYTKKPVVGVCGS